MFARSSFRNRPASWCVALLLVVPVIAGCAPEPEIRSYDVPRDAAAADGKSTEAVATRMMAAVVPRESEAWFFKLTGPEKAVAEVEGQVRDFIKSLEIPDDDANGVTWDVPENWQDAGSRPMREATLTIPGAEPPLELAISTLSYDGDLQPYLLANVNRWRGQVGLEPVESVDETAGVEEIQLDGGTAWLLDATGEMPGGAAQPPMMQGSPPAAGPPGATAAAPGQRPAAPPRAEKPKLEFQTPDGWQELPRGSMGSLNYAVGTGDEQATIRLSDFPPVGVMDDPLANINRWRGQLGLEPITNETLAEHTEAVEIAGEEGVAAQMTSPDGSQTMLAAMVVKFDHVWFFQLMGTPSAVEANREEFISWLKDVRITQPENESGGAE